MKENEIPFNPDLTAALANASEILLPLAAIAKDMNSKIHPSIKALQSHQEYLSSTKESFSRISFFTKNIYGSLREFQSPLWKTALLSAGWPELVMESDALKQIRTVSELWKENLNDILSPLTKSDFRIGVISQELEQVIAEDPEEITEKLLFKNIPEPSNEVESCVFQILYEFRQVPVDSTELSGTTNDSTSKDVPENKIEDIHNSPAFYENKMWYAEVMLGIIIEKIYAATIGVNPRNTIGFALLLACLITFISMKDKK